MNPKDVIEKLDEIQKQITELNLLKKEIWNSCTHEGYVSYEFDPSGNDGGYVCGACGACWSRRPFCYKDE